MYIIFLVLLEKIVFKIFLYQGQKWTLSQICVYIICKFDSLLAVTSFIYCQLQFLLSGYCRDNSMSTFIDVQKRGALLPVSIFFYYKVLNHIGTFQFQLFKDISPNHLRTFQKNTTNFVRTVELKVNFIISCSAQAIHSAHWYKSYQVNSTIIHGLSSN